MKKKTTKREIKDLFTGLAFIFPSFLGFLIFTLIPVIISLFLSFSQWNFMEGWGAIKFTGLENYIRLFTDEWFLNSYRNNIVFTVVTVPALLALGLVIAVIVNKYIWGGGVVRILIFIPYIASVVAVCTVWMVLLQPSYGPINSFLRAIGIENPPGWLTDFKWSLPSIMLIYVWQQVGYYAIVFIAGLKGISEDVYEAASIDGASTVRQFFSIVDIFIYAIDIFYPETFIVFAFQRVSASDTRYLYDMIFFQMWDIGFPFHGFPKAKWFVARTKKGKPKY